MIVVGINHNQEVVFLSKGFAIEDMEEKEGIYLYEVLEMPTFDPRMKCCFDPESGSFYSKEYTRSEMRDIKTAVELMHLKDDARRKREEALAWLAENDWKINKHTLGEWTDTDERWIEYVEMRAQKRSEIDEAEKILKE